MQATDIVDAWEIKINIGNRWASMTFAGKPLKFATRTQAQSLLLSLLPNGDGGDKFRVARALVKEAK